MDRQVIDVHGGIAFLLQPVVTMAGGADAVEVIADVGDGLQRGWVRHSRNLPSFRQSNGGLRLRLLISGSWRYLALATSGSEALLLLGECWRGFGQIPTIGVG
jgi:hypothetical protein